MEIIKTYVQKQPAARFIGVKYTPKDSVNGSYGAKWGEAFATGLLDKIEALTGGEEYFEDSGAYIGLMSEKHGEYTYWIGMFTAPGTQPPEGMGYVDFPESDIGVGWLYGVENELYCHETDVIEKLNAMGVTPKTMDGTLWCFERYQCPRFTSPDYKGNVILDMCFFI